MTAYDDYLLRDEPGGAGGRDPFESYDNAPCQFCEAETNADGTCSECDGEPFEIRASFVVEDGRVTEVR